MPDFRVYYADQPPYAGDPYNAPAFGVLLILEHDPETGRRIVQGGDYYGWTGTRWMPYDQAGFFDYLQTPGAKRVLFGRLVTNEEYQAVYDQAAADPDFEPRTAWGRINSKVR